jgi:small membrane protein
MIPIQIILISAVVFVTFYMYLRLRNNLLDAILIFLFCLGAVFFILFPDTTTDIAQRLGVKRGINLVFYGVTLFFFFLILKLYSRVRKLENKFTEMVRENSLKKAEELSEKGKENAN